MNHGDLAAWTIAIRHYTARLSADASHATVRLRNAGHPTVRLRNLDLTNNEPEVRGNGAPVRILPRPV